MLTTQNTVSYTHLDVYKRQVDENGNPITQVKIRTVLTCRSHRGVCAKCYGSNLATGQAVQAVSYTHLDLYKRQATTRDLSYLRVTRLRQAMLSQTVLQQVRESLLLERTRLSDS